MGKMGEIGSFVYGIQRQAERRKKMVLLVEWIYWIELDWQGLESTFIFS